MKTFSVIFDDELFDKVETARDKRPRTDFIRDVIKSYFITESSQKDNINSQNPNMPSQMISDCALLQAKNESLEELVKAKDQNIKDLQNQIGFLIQDHTRISGQLDRLLMPSPEEITKKAWWQFWK